jgi:O-antigen/teichoic acid export membrane protein
LQLAVARANGRAADLLATTVTLRLVLAGLVVGPLLAVLHLLGYDPLTRTVASLFTVGAVCACLGLGPTAVMRGLERVDRAAVVRVSGEVLRTLVIVTAVALGARIHTLAALEIVAPAVVLGLWARWVRALRLGGGRPSLTTASELLRGGAPFLVMGGILAAEPMIEAVLLSKLASRDAVGWFAASGKLVSLMLTPATLLMGALSPTLARLCATDEMAFRRVAREALRMAFLMGAPIAVAALMFAEPAMTLVYGARGFGPAADNLRVMSAYILPVFVNIALGTVILASGKQLPWALSKLVIVGISLAAAWFAIPYWEQHSGNGGLGAAGVTAAAEIGMLMAAAVFVPRHIVERSIALDALRVLGAAGCMAAVTHVLASGPWGVALAGSVLVYAAALVLSGAIGPRDLDLVRDTVRSALRRQ